EDIILEEWREYSERSEVQILAPGSLRCTFVLEPAVVDFLGMNLSASMTKAVETVVRGNFWFSQVKHVRLELGKELWDDELESKKVFGQLLNGLFSSTRRSRELTIPKCRSSFDVYNPKTKDLQIERVQLLFPSSMSPSDFVAAASAIAVTQTVKKLTISPVVQLFPRINTRIWWTWLAYALFSKRARAFSSLESVTFVKLRYLCTDDMVKLAEVITSEHPEEKLFDTPRGELGEKIATVTRGAPIRWKFDYGELVPEVEPLSFPMSIPFVLTFSDDGVSEWVNVLVPGYGRCQVQRDNLEFHETSEYETRPCLKTLKIGFIHENNTINNSLPLLLAAVGHSLNNLALSARTLDIDVSTILRYCPNLVELSLCGAVVDVMLKFDNYREFLQSFSGVDFNWNNVIALSRTLSNDNNPLAKCVHRLRVRPVSEAELNALLDMLTQNLTLKYMEITIPTQFQRRIESFRKFNLQPIHHTMKLSLKSKAAFISTIESNETGNHQQKSPLHELSQELLCKIFAYAISPTPRRVFARCVPKP
ncbi:hypothetical protein PHMEG_00035610, partial [Phytophthora megakarya]